MYLEVQQKLFKLYISKFKLLNGYNNKDKNYYAFSASLRLSSTRTREISSEFAAGTVSQYGELLYFCWRQFASINKSDCICSI